MCGRCRASRRSPPPRSCSTGSSCCSNEDISPETLRESDPRKLIPPLHGALLKNEQDVHLFERLAFLARRQGAGLSEMINEAPLARFPHPRRRARQADLRRLLLRQHRQHDRAPADRRSGADRCCRPTASAATPIPQPQKVVPFFVDSFGWEFWQQYHRRFRTTAPRRRAGHADADLGAVSLHHRRLGLHPEPRRAAGRARALRVEHLHPGLRRGDPVARLLPARACARRMPA